MMGICHTVVLSVQTARREDLGDAKREPQVSLCLLEQWNDSQTLLGQSSGHWPDTDPTRRHVQLRSDKLVSM